MAKNITQMAAVPQASKPAAVQDTAQAAATLPNSAGQAVKSFTNQAAGVTAGFEKTQMEVKAKMDKAMKTAEQMVSFGQGNMEAVIKSGQIWAAGFQDLGKSFAATAQAQLDQTVSTWKALAGVKSLKEAIDLQSSLARSSIETAMSQTGQADRRVDQAGRAGAGPDHRSGDAWRSSSSAALLDGRSARPRGEPMSGIAEASDEEGPEYSFRAFFRFPSARLPLRVSPLRYRAPARLVPRARRPICDGPGIAMRPVLRCGQFRARPWGTVAISLI